MDLFVAKIIYKRNPKNCTGVQNGEYLVGIYNNHSRALTNAKRKLKYMLTSDIDDSNFYGVIEHDVRYEIRIEHEILNITHRGLPWDEEAC